MKNIDRCRICGGLFFPGPLLELCNVPAAAQNFPSAETLSSDHGIDLELRQCSCCGVVQLTNEPVSYYRDVIRAAGVSEEMHDFRLTQFHKWISDCHLQNTKILEIGCGKGEYMQIMRSAGGDVYGTEHCAESVRYCHSHGLKAQKIFPDTGNERFENGPFGGFYILNYLEHIPDIRTFMQGIRNNLYEGAAGLVEVPNFDMMIRNGLIFEFTLDHLYYFTASSLRTVLESCGFEVLEMKTVWYDYILSAQVRKKYAVGPESFLSRKEQLLAELSSFLKSRSRIAVWGAGHQALTVLAMSNLASRISYVIDSSPFKQGKYTHTTHLPIVPPDTLKTDPVEAVLVMCAGYSDEVSRILREKYDPSLKIGILRENHVEILL